MKKRLLSLTVAATLCATVLAGCGSDKAGSGDKAGAEGGSDYPSKAVTVVVPYSAGGGTDTVCRALVDSAKDSFPKNISVENREGAGGATGMLYGANAAKDGSVVTMITVELTTLEHMGTGAGLEAGLFSPIMMVNSAPSAITVKADSPYNTLEDFLAAAKTEEIQVGNSGVGAIWHLAAAGLAKEAGVEFKHVPYDGAAGAITDLLGGNIDAVSVSYAEVASQVEAGQLKVLATMSDERLKATPDIPTCKELGYDVSIGTWRGLGVPTGTDQAIIDKLYDIFSKAAESSAFVDFMNNSNNDIDILGPDDFKKKIEDNNELFKNLINDLGLAQ